MLRSLRLAKVDMAALLVVGYESFYVRLTKISKTSSICFAGSKGSNLDVAWCDLKEKRSRQVWLSELKVKC